MVIGAGSGHNAVMDLRERFEGWLAREVRGTAVPVLRAHLQGRDYRLYSCTEYLGRILIEAYHPERGFFRATGRSHAEALRGLLRQIWLVDALAGSPAPEVGPGADR